MINYIDRLERELEVLELELAVMINKDYSYTKIMKHLGDMEAINNSINNLKGKQNELYQYIAS